MGGIQIEDPYELTPEERMKLIEIQEAHHKQYVGLGFLAFLVFGIPLAVHLWIWALGS